MLCNLDEYGEVINGELTYRWVSLYLRQHKPVLIGWTDEVNTHLDILFSCSPRVSGTIQGGLSRHELFISIMRIGAYGFNVSGGQIHQIYISEKLNVHGEPTLYKLTELINGVIAYLKPDCISV